MDKAIIARNIYKKYKLYHGTRERLFDFITPKSFGEGFYALRDINIELEKGDIVGFVGINGSGKSTLSNIIAGIVPPTNGEVTVNGQASLIAVAAGLRGDLSGRDNIELKLLMLGFNKKEILDLEPAIIEFAELEKFIDQPVKSYSSGMKSRLGFSISINVDPDILIIDEALSVGDKAFAEKSLNKMKEFKKQGKTMIFVSHSIGQMKQFCEKILWLEFGMVKDYGTVEEVLPKYENFLSRWQKMPKGDREKYRRLAMELDEEGLKDLMEEDDEDAPADSETSKETYQEIPVSRIGHIKGGKSYIYSTPTDLNEKMSSKNYKHSAYFIKRQVTLNNELFYQLSDKPSGINGVIGWMKAVDLSSHDDITIDYDTKGFYIKGSGSSYDRPWGGKKNLVHSDLASFTGQLIKVEQTVKVGKNLWYRGMVNSIQTWIHISNLKDAES